MESALNAGIAFVVIAFILSLVAVVLAFIFIVPEKKRAKLNKFGQLLHDILNFKFLIVEKILQALYIFATAFVIICGFLMLFYVEEGYYNSSQWQGGKGLLLMILGPIVVRLIYELLMMFILVVKNVISINNKLKNQNSTEAGNDPFNTPSAGDIKNVFQPQAQPTGNAQPPYAAPAAPAAPAAQNGSAFCPNCGAPVEAGAPFCPNCGTKLS